MEGFLYRGDAVVRTQSCFSCEANDMHGRMRWHAGSCDEEAVIGELGWIAWRWVLKDPEESCSAGFFRIQLEEFRVEAKFEDLN